MVTIGPNGVRLPHPTPPLDPSPWPDEYNNYNDSVNDIIDVMPYKIYHTADVYISWVIDQISGSWQNMMGSWKDLHLGWTGQTQQEADDLMHAIDGVQGKLLGKGTPGAPDFALGLLDQIRLQAMSGGVNHSAAESSVAAIFDGMTATIGASEAPIEAVANATANLATDTATYNALTHEDPTKKQQSGRGQGPPTQAVTDAANAVEADKKALAAAQAALDAIPPSLTPQTDAPVTETFATQ